MTGNGESSNTAAGLEAGGAWFWLANTTDDEEAAVRGVLGATDLGVFEDDDWPAAGRFEIVWVQIGVSLGLLFLVLKAEPQD